MKQDPNEKTQKQLVHINYPIPIKSFDIDIPSELGDSNIGDDYLRREILLSMRQRLLHRNLIMKNVERNRKWRNVIGSILSLLAAAVVTRTLLLSPEDTLSIGDAIAVTGIALSGTLLFWPSTSGVGTSSEESDTSQKAPGDGTDPDRDDRLGWPGGDSGGKKDP